MASPSNGYFQDLLENLKREPVKTTYSTFGVVGMIAVWIYFGALAGMACNFIGFLYPAYQSIKAIESDNSNDDTEWLMYWVVYSLFSVAEYFSDFLLSWFPLYYLGKCFFLLWCMSPRENNGSRFIYTKIISPFVMKHEAKIDEAINKATTAASDALGNVQQEAQSAVANAATEVMQKAFNPYAMGNLGKEVKKD